MATIFVTHELFHACRELFGPEVDLSTDFLDYLRPEGVKSAFRKRARATHPDLLPHDQSASIDQSDSFLRLHDAYTLINDYLKHAGRSELRLSPPSRFRDTQSPDPLYTGALPRRRLLFGRYLYYLGVISHRTLLSAITWQRNTTRRMGVLARESGWLTCNDVTKILSTKGSDPFGERAVRIGLLTEVQRKRLVLQQRIGHRRIGEYFVTHGFITEDELEVLLKGVRLHNVRQGRI